jgi:hypothetical protein
VNSVFGSNCCQHSLVVSAIQAADIVDCVHRVQMSVFTEASAGKKSAAA